PAGWLGKFGCRATILVVLCPQQVRIGRWEVAMSAGTIAGDRIWALAGPAPTPRVSLRPPSGFAVSSPIAVPARASCHRQASPRRERGLWSWRHLARQWSASPVAAAYPFGGRGAAGPACAGGQPPRRPKRAGRRLLVAGPPAKAAPGISQGSG